MSRLIISTPILKESASEEKSLKAVGKKHSWHSSNCLNCSIILPLQSLKFISDFGKKK